MPPTTPHDPHFQPIYQQQAGLPHLVQLLLQQYREQAHRDNQARQAPVDAESQIQAARPLLDFFERYLSAYRPVQAFALDNNYGLLLSNNLRCSVSPGANFQPGSMQDSHAVEISQGLSNPGQEGVVEVNDQRQIR